MPKTRLTAYTPASRPASAILDNEIIINETGEEINRTKDYGIGIDCHSKFIQVCVIVKEDYRYLAYQKEFNTEWSSLVKAKQWSTQVLQTKAVPAIVPDSSFHYCIESTSVYHFPILMAWEGTVSVVNPTIAGATKRKTDVLDAKLLAVHDLTSVWSESYISPAEVKGLRLLVAEREHFVKLSSQCANRINNAIIRFGITIGRSGSVVKNEAIRQIVEDQISDTPPILEELCPTGIPKDVRPMIQREYEKYDEFQSYIKEYDERIRNKVLSMKWETASGKLNGEEMLRILMSAPQVGETTAIIWLTFIITPNRFPNAKALAAYCGLDPSLKISAKHVTSTVKRGGCKALHKTLTSCADRLIRNHTEMFGQWGYNLYLQTGKWKKASNAVARKLAVALYFMMLTGKEFSYEKYSLIKNISVFNISVDELPELIPDFKRYIKILHENNINNTSELVTAFLSCSLGSCKGLGKKFFSTLREFMNNQHKYKQIYENMRCNL